MAIVSRLLTSMVWDRVWDRVWELETKQIGIL